MLLRRTLGILITLSLSWTVHAATELARINQTVVTLEDFNKRYKENLKYFQAKPPTKKNLMEDIIKRELALQEAKKLGLDKDPEVLDRMNTVLYHAFVDRKLGAEIEKIQVSDEEARRYYTQNPEVRTSHIFVALRPDAPKEEEAKAMERIKKIYEDEIKPAKSSFAEIAQRLSDGIAAPMGGDIDYQTKDKLDPVYYQTAIALKTPGKISGIVRTQFGLHIIKLTAIRPWEEADHIGVKRVVFEQRRSEMFDRLMNQLRSQAKVSVRTDLLKE